MHENAPAMDDVEILIGKGQVFQALALKNDSLRKARAVQILGGLAEHVFGNVYAHAAIATLPNRQGVIADAAAGVKNGPPPPAAQGQDAIHHAGVKAILQRIAR